MRRLRLRRRGFARQIAGLERFKQLQMALNVALDHGDEIQRGLLGVIQPLLLGVQLLIELRKLHVRGVDLRIGLRIDLRVLQHGGAPRLRFLEQLGAFGLCIGCGSGLLRLLRAYSSSFSTRIFILALSTEFSL